MIEAADLPPGDWIALEVKGDSMDRISPPESVIFVNRSERRLVPNACYIIQDGEGGATYKRYRQSPVRFEPVSTNSAHEAIYPDGDNMPIIFGRVYRSMINM
jgi:phage repressor protein C with HTH and peptisase S24 domain